MNGILSVGLVNNAILLLVLSVIYEIGYLLPRKLTRYKQIINGLLVGMICLIIMSMPFAFLKGVIFDTRSILLSVTAYIFGPVPALIAAVIAVVYRISMGGVRCYRRDHSYPDECPYRSCLGQD